LLRIRGVNPVLVYDRDCRFCGRWVARWQARTGARVDYVPFQEPGILARLGIPLASARRSVQLAMPDGRRYQGAEAVLRLVQLAPGRHLLARIGLLPIVRWFAERFYRLVAGNRKMASRIDRLLARRLFSRPTAPRQYGALHPRG
jgi:predicted DCC family thiol-disulfide oxidoreductase YuxK